jgi:cholesterol transport system auxiliary component
MRLVLRITTPLALALAVSGCSLGGMLGGGGKGPAWLLTLTPEAPAPASLARAAAAGDTVTINVPVIAKELRTTRVPAQLSPTAVQYVEDLTWIDTPDRLFQTLLSETVRRTTNRVVLDGKQTAFDPGLLITGQLNRFGFDDATQAVIVQYDAAKSAGGGTQVDTRRFEASVPATGDAASVGAALNRGANQVALEVAAWIGG